jgi:signal peptidase I
MAGRPKSPKRGPIRDNLEAFGIAILAAVLLKYFAIEAYQIPTSSMQPTLMGSTEAGVYDRILVDKLRYELTDPQRWDVTVFRYPLQKNQNYVKRCVGMPGDNLHIAGGNLYRVTEADGQRTYQVLRKPARIQSGLWKEVYPLRRLVRGDPTVLGSSFFGSPDRSWSEAGSAVSAELERGRTCRLIYRDDKDGGLVDRLWDGYPLAVAQAMRKEHFQTQHGLEIVPDVRLEAVVEPQGTLDSLAFEIEVVRPGRPRMVFALEIEAGQARLVVRAGESSLLSSPPFPCPFGRTTALAFARLDDELIAWIDGTEAQRLDVAAHPVREGCALTGGVPGPQQGARAGASITLKGQGRTTLRDLRLLRDLHYTHGGLPLDHVIRVPEGHYFMMGDNTLQSVDARDWTAIRIGVLDGAVVPPDTPGARVLRGNKRPMPPSKPPDRDETPVVIPSRNAIVMIDEFGEIHRLRARVANASASLERYEPSFLPADGGDGQAGWRPPEEKVPFVPREHVVGRALLVFWPIWPLQHRLGFIR